jgi:hypothetical protein
VCAYRGMLGEGNAPVVLDQAVAGQALSAAPRARIGISLHLLITREARCSRAALAWNYPRPERPGVLRSNKRLQELQGFRGYVEPVSQRVKRIGHRGPASTCHSDRNRPPYISCPSLLKSRRWQASVLIHWCGSPSAAHTDPILSPGAAGVKNALMCEAAPH